MKLTLVLFTLGLVVGLLLTAVGYQFISKDYSYQGSLIDPPVPAADFELTNQYNEKFRLSDHQGKLSLIFFGYTNCPDVCPVTLSEFKKIKMHFNQREEEINFIFITVDPERDTSNRLKVYLQNFDPKFIGLTGERDLLESVWESYGVYEARQDLGSAAGYLVDHSARVYAIDKNGNWRLTYPFGMDTEKLIQDIEHLLDEG